MLFDYYLFTVVHIDALCVGLGVESLAVEGVPCLAVEAHLAGAGVQGADGGDFTVGADEAHADGLGQGVVTGRGSGPKTLQGHAKSGGEEPEDTWYDLE